MRTLLSFCMANTRFRDRLSLGQPQCSLASLPKGGRPIMAKSIRDYDTAWGSWMPETRADEKKLKVFISYSRKDLAFAQKIVAALETRGLTPKIDTRDLPKLEDWRTELL